MLLATVGFIAVFLTVAMFLSRNPMLGFPTTIFWALFGAQAYTLSTVLWDIYFLIAFASLLGMTTFSALGAYGLREKPDTIADEELETGDGKFIDEDGEKSSEESEDVARPSKRILRLHKRAERRRSG